MTNSERTLRDYFTQDNSCTIVILVLCILLTIFCVIAYTVENHSTDPALLIVIAIALAALTVLLGSYAIHLEIKDRRKSLQQLADHQYLAGYSAQQIQDSLTELEQRLETQRSHIDGLVAERDRLRTEYDKATADIENQISDIRGEISDIQKEIDIRQQLLKAHSKT